MPCFNPESASTGLRNGSLIQTNVQIPAGMSQTCVFTVRNPTHDQRAKITTYLRYYCCLGLGWVKTIPNTAVREMKYAKISLQTMYHSVLHCTTSYDQQLVINFEKKGAQIEACLKNLPSHLLKTLSYNAPAGLYVIAQ